MYHLMFYSLNSISSCDSIRVFIRASLSQKFVKKYFLDLGGHIETLKRKHIINFKRNLVNFHGLIQN